MYMSIVDTIPLYSSIENMDTTCFFRSNSFFVQLFWSNKTLQFTLLEWIFFVRLFRSNETTIYFARAWMNQQHFLNVILSVLIEWNILFCSKWNIFLLEYMLHLLWFVLFKKTRTKMGATSFVWWKKCFNQKKQNRQFDLFDEATSFVTIRFVQNNKMENTCLVRTKQCVLFKQHFDLF
jgi:hypothetical protein